jgi:hypothetical protein
VYWILLCGPEIVICARQWSDISPRILNLCYFTTARIASRASNCSYGIQCSEHGLWVKFSELVVVMFTSHCHWNCRAQSLSPYGASSGWLRAWVWVRGLDHLVVTHSMIFSKKGVKRSVWPKTRLPPTSVKHFPSPLKAGTLQKIVCFRSSCETA